MFKHGFLGDAWIREAEEASRLIEDIETRIKDNNNTGQRLRDSARWKLLELGPKLDRLESLLHNPPAKPILTDQDLDLRRNMLSEIQLRTRAVALGLYAFQFTDRHGSVPTSDTKETTETISSYDQDYMKATVSNQDQDLMVPLVPTDDASRSSSQRKQISSLASKRWIWKACWVIFLVLAIVALLLVLFIVCAVI